jgi:hypothetical protein
MEEANDQCAGRNMGYNVDNMQTWVDEPSCSEDSFPAIKGTGMVNDNCVPKSTLLAVQCVANVPRS